MLSQASPSARSDDLSVSAQGLFLQIVSVRLIVVSFSLFSKSSSHLLERISDAFWLIEDQLRIVNQRERIFPPSASSRRTKPLPPPQVHPSLEVL